MPPTATLEFKNQTMDDAGMGEDLPDKPSSSRRTSVRLKNLPPKENVSNVRLARKFSKKRKGVTFHNDQEKVEGYRCSPHMIPPLMKKLSKKQRKFVENIGFQSMQNMKMCSLPKGLTMWLIHRVDATKGTLEVNGIPINIKEKVKDILDLPCGILKVPPPLNGRSNCKRPKLEDSCLDDMKHSKDGKGLTANEYQKLVLGEEDEEEFSRSFVLLVLCWFLAPTTSHNINRNYLPVLRDVTKIAKMDWCGFIADYLIQAIREMKNNTANHIQVPGCVYLLAVIYLDAIKSDQINVPKGLPRIHHVGTEHLVLLASLDVKSSSKDQTEFGALQESSSTQHPSRKENSIIISKRRKLGNQVPKRVWKRRKLENEAFVESDRSTDDHRVDPPENQTVDILFNDLNEAIRSNRKEMTRDFQTKLAESQNRLLIEFQDKLAESEDRIVKHFRGQFALKFSNSNSSVQTPSAHSSPPISDHPSCHVDLSPAIQNLSLYQSNPTTTEHDNSGYATADDHIATFISGETPSQQISHVGTSRVHDGTLESCSEGAFPVQQPAHVNIVGEENVQNFSDSGAETIVPVTDTHGSANSVQENRSDDGNENGIDQPNAQANPVRTNCCASNLDVPLSGQILIPSHKDQQGLSTKTLPIESGDKPVLQISNSIIGCSNPTFHVSTPLNRCSEVEEVYGIKAPHADNDQQFEFDDRMVDRKNAVKEATSNAERDQQIDSQASTRSSGTEQMNLSNVRRSKQQETSSSSGNEQLNHSITERHNSRMQGDEMDEKRKQEYLACDTTTVLKKDNPNPSAQCSNSIGENIQQGSDVHGHSQKIHLILRTKRDECNSGNQVLEVIGGEELTTCATYANEEDLGIEFIKTQTPPEDLAANLNSKGFTPESSTLQGFTPVKDTHDSANSVQENQSDDLHEVTAMSPQQKLISASNVNQMGEINKDVIIEGNENGIDQPDAQANPVRTNCCVSDPDVPLSGKILIPSHKDQVTAKNVVQDMYSPGGLLVRLQRKKLLILDLNGLLADITPNHRSSRDSHLAHANLKIVRGKNVFIRPHHDDFLRFCFQNFELGVWSSRMKVNVDAVVDILMKDLRRHLLFCWDASHCTTTKYNTLENQHKPLVLKELKKLWNKEDPNLRWEQGKFSPSNTLLVDDSPYKALCNPPHTAIFPQPYSYHNRTDNSLGPGGDLRVYLENLAAADDVQEHPFGQPFITESDPNWAFYAKIRDRLEKPERSVPLDGPVP